MTDLFSEKVSEEVSNLLFICGAKSGLLICINTIFVK